MNGVGVFLGPISDGAAGTAVNLKRSGKLSQGGSTPPKENEIRGPRPAAAGCLNNFYSQRQIRVGAVEAYG